MKQSEDGSWSTPSSKTTSPENIESQTYLLDFNNPCSTPGFYWYRERSLEAPRSLGVWLFTKCWQGYLEEGNANKLPRKISYCPKTDKFRSNQEFFRLVIWYILAKFKSNTCNRFPHLRNQLTICRIPKIFGYASVLNFRNLRPFIHIKHLQTFRIWHSFVRSCCKFFNARIFGYMGLKKEIIHMEKPTGKTIGNCLKQ